MIKTNQLILVMLFIIAVFLAFNLFAKSPDYANLERAYANPSSGAIKNSDMMICPVQVTANEEYLFMITRTTSKRKGQPTTPELYMLVYGMDRNKGLNFIAARRIEYDTDVGDLGFSQSLPKRLKPRAIKNEIDKWNKEYKKTE